jgi:hypothetical protein
MSKLQIEKIAQAKLNKKRSQIMEREVAKLLKGNRVPMSGAGQIKGDCVVPFDSFRSIYIECKYTQNDYITLAFHLFTKMQRESIAMRSVFPMLIFRFWGLKEYWCLFSDEDSEPLFDVYGKPEWYRCAFVDNGETRGKTTRTFYKDKVTKLPPFRFTINSEKYQLGSFYCVNIKEIIKLMSSEPF